MKRIMIAALAVAGTLALSAGCEQKGSTPAERGGTTSAPMSRGPAGSDTARAPGDRAAGASASSPGAANDMSGTGGSGDAGMGRDAGMMR